MFQGPDGNEGKQEYDDFCAGVQDHYSPVGWLGELCSEKIVVCLGDFAASCALKVARFRLLLRGTATSSGNQKRKNWRNRNLPPPSDPDIDAMTDHLFLPEKEDLDKLLRYEAMINRQLNHAMGELERVQTRRKGEVTPDPAALAKQSQEVL